MPHTAPMTVVPMSRQDPSHPTPIVLMQNNWDDFGFKTSYSLYYSSQSFSGLIGGLKILRYGQETSAACLLPIGPLEALDENWISMGNSLDYYERLSHLPYDERSRILDLLQDATFKPSRADKFETETGWKKSVLRDNDYEEHRSVSSVLLHGDYTTVPARSLELTFQLAGWDLPLKLSFASGDHDLWHLPGTLREGLPERMAVLVGRNGSGKSTLLSRLARVLHASQADRAKQPIIGLGKIEPAGVGFARIINVAYSAFDTFHVPGVGRAERLQIIEDLNAGTGRYVFCGLRDIARELKERIDEADALVAGATESEQQALDQAADAVDWFARDRQETTYLKSTETLGREFADNISRARIGYRNELLARASKILLSDSSFGDTASLTLDEFLGDDPASQFASWSTGHKIVMHTLATIVANIRPKSIVLIDEPESHLHPPLLAALMHAIRRLLDLQDSFAIVATHSPVVAQETLRRHVAVVNRVENVTTLLPPKIETYGESFGEIANAVFGLNPNASDFYRTLRILVSRGLTLEDIEERFDYGMSLQARAYVMMLLASRPS